MRAKLVLVVVGAIVIYAASRRSPSPSKVDPAQLAHHAPPAEADVEAHASSPAVTVSALDRQIDDKLAADPIAKTIPMLFDLSKQKQLETLYWMKYVPREKLLEFFPRFAEGVELSLEEQRTLALETIDGFIKDLEQQGIKAPTPKF